jgi:hypothetical protein
MMPEIQGVNQVIDISVIIRLKALLFGDKSNF